MRIERIELCNWLRYQGEHSILLDGGVYAVTGEFGHDARRSNWAGKTSLLEAVRFALYGAHRASREDDWITTGEPSGYVELVVTGGIRIRRERRRGHATKLVVMSGSGSDATGDAAQESICRIVGLTQADFDATCWMAQRQMARFVLARPGERFEIVTGWVGLEPLQRCEERARRRLSETTVAMAQAEMAARVAEGAMLEVRTLLGLAATTSVEDAKVALDGRLEEESKRLAVVAVAIEAAKDSLALAHRRRERVRREGELAEVRASLTDARARFEALPAVDAAATDALVAAKAAMVEAGGQVRAKAALVRGEFDGACPVAGIRCPATHDINRMGAENRVAHKQAVLVYDDACRAEALARHAADAARDADQQRAGLLGLRDRLRQQHATLTEILREPAVAGPSVEDAQVALDDAMRAYREAEAAVAPLRAAYRTMEAQDLARGQALARAEKARDEAAILRAALRVFGRQGAQQRVAEVALSEIEAGANALLRDAGIDLSVTMRWGRDAASGLATTCDACGAPHPASQKVRACERCGAPRGPRVIERLDVELSDRSGAAEDLAGTALQLAAAAWLRTERDVQWSVALIDEPFGALDEAHRRAFASHLTKMLRGRFGFEQAFVVAHSPDVLDAMPGRVVVRADEYGSRLEVA